MKTIVPIFLAFCAGGLLAADDDETKFKAKTYAPGKPLSDTAYRAAPYTPSPATKSVGAPAAPENPSGSRWSFFTRKPAEASKPAPGEQSAHATPYVQQKHTAVPTIKADARAVQEKNPYVSTDTAPDYPFKPAEKSEWKNPLLKPRQGIKEPAE